MTASVLKYHPQVKNALPISWHVVEGPTPLLTESLASTKTEFPLLDVALLTVRLVDGAIYWKDEFLARHMKSRGILIV